MQIKPEYLSYLNEIHNDGVSTADPALPFRLLQEKFPELTLDQARAVIKAWKEQHEQLLNE